MKLKQILTRLTIARLSARCPECLLAIVLGACTVAPVYG